MRKLLSTLAVGILMVTVRIPESYAGDKALVDTSKSPDAKMYMPDMGDVRWEGGLWGDRFEVCRQSMIPYMWSLFEDDKKSSAWMNFRAAAGLEAGKTGGPPFNDGDFLKWFEAVAQMYAVTKDPKLDALMDEIIPVIAKAQRSDGYLFTQQMIAVRQGKKQKEFSDPDHFETYNMGHLMTAACVHYRATGKKTMLKLAEKSAAYMEDFCKRAPADLAKNAICPSHYMGAVELYRATGDTQYLKLANDMINIRGLVTNGTDQNQDRVPFREQTEAVGHAVRANYLYAGVADVVAEDGDATLMKPLELIADDVARHKLYITGMTGAKYDAASPEGSKNHTAIQLTAQAYGRNYELPNLTAYNESCATIGYAMWTYRMLEVTGDARYADLFEQALYNGVLAGISLDGTKYFYANPLRKMADYHWPLRWSRTRVPNIPSSFCCPPNLVRTIAEAQNYIYALSKDTVWVNLYGGSTLDTHWTQESGGGEIKLHQETDYPWAGEIKITIDAAPEREIGLKLRIPGWMKAGEATLKINGEVAVPSEKLTPGTYAEVKRAWKAGDSIELNLQYGATMWEANPLVEETANQVAVKYGPVVYCLEGKDLPKDVKVEDVAVGLDGKHREFRAEREEIAGAMVVTLTGTGLEIPRNTTGALYREIGAATAREIPIKLIPYYAWDNRGDYDMTVWLPVR
ncbi:MAG: glycoside hydrolase family 127 protein [Phycisphaerae bacterium]